MKNAILVFFLCYGIATLAQDQTSPDKVISGFSHPESVVFDEEREYFYVSNMADQEEGDGFISRLSKNGEIKDLSWITGLDSPKGLLIKEDRLYVTDITVLVEMDINSGEILNRIPVEGAKSLNDPAMDEEGNIYFSDLAGGKIYKMDVSGEIEEWLSGPELENPNGLFIEPDFILVGGWGENTDGNLLKVNRNIKEVGQITNEGIGNLDGIQKKADGEYYISDWATGTIYAIDLDGNIKKVLTSAKSSGDILYLKNENKLVLPMNHQNEIWIYSVD